MKFPPFLSCLLALLLTSCGPSYVYEEAHPISVETGWTYDDAAQFEFAITDTNQLYNLHLFVEHGVDFGYQNTYVNIRTFFPGGDELADKVSLQLADKFGQWYGDCDQENCTLDIPIQQSIYFKEAGSYRIVIEQYSRDNPLKSVKQIGFALEEVKR